MIAETNRGKICWPIPAGTNRNTGGMNWSIPVETSRNKLSWKCQFSWILVTNKI